MRDPYEVLGVNKQADAAAIKSGYRRLAKKLHPDANKDDPKASARFAELNTAYEVLGDEDKRKAFDRGEIDGEGKPRFTGFEGAQPGGGFRGGFENFGGGNFRQGGAGGGAGFEDILRGMFGGAAGGARRSSYTAHDFGEDFGQSPAPGQDVTGAVTITLEEAAHGGARRVHLPSGKDIEVKIPTGLNDGQTIRLKGQGLPGPGGVGDALITVTIAVHRFFVRDGANLRLDLPVTLYEAVLGGRVRVPTLKGAVELAIPANTSNGRIFRLKGKGMPAKAGDGDLYATIRVALPDHADTELEGLMQKMRDTAPYHPRKDME